MTASNGDRSPPTLLVLRALGLGDLLTAVPCLRALRRTYPHHRFVLAAPAALRPLVELIGGVDDVHDTSGLGSLSWHGPPPDIAVNLHGRGPESIRDLLQVAPRRLITHRHPDLPEVTGLEWRSNIHEIDRWVRLLEYAGTAVDRNDLDLLPPPASATDDSGCVVIHPGAASAARRWPAERFALVAEAVARTGRTVIITGGPGEHALAFDVALRAGLPEESVRADLSLPALAAAVARAELVICGDTGVGHLATSYRTRSLLLFGPTPPHLWGPPSDRHEHVVLWSGDIGDPHGDTPHHGLLLISAKRAITAVETLLEGEPHHVARGRR
jgi:ADP-heptose:LPS heptosyltransferase